MDCCHPILCHRRQSVPGEKTKTSADHGVVNGGDGSSALLCQPLEQGLSGCGIGALVVEHWNPGAVGIILVRPALLVCVKAGGIVNGGEPGQMDGRAAGLAQPLHGGKGAALWGADLIQFAVDEPHGDLTEKGNVILCKPVVLVCLTDRESGGKEGGVFQKQ